MSQHFKVYLPVFTNDQGVTTTVPSNLSDGQLFKEVYVGPEFFLDHSIAVDGSDECVTLRKAEPNVTHLSDYEHRQMHELCKTIHLNPSYCELFYCRVGDHPYVPSANGLKLWKIQRHLYRYINDTIYKNIAESNPSVTEPANRITSTNSIDGDQQPSESNSVTLVDILGEGSLYNVDELSPGNDDMLAHYMKDLNISFEILDARGRIQEIAAQVRHHNIPFELRLRDSNGQVFHILD